MELYFVKETGDVLKYLGETLVDPHKGEYDPYYKVVLGSKFKLNDEVVQFELHDKDYKYYTLIKLPKTTDIKSLDIKTLKLIYG